MSSAPAERSREPAAGRTVRWTRWRRATQLLIVAFFVALPFSYGAQAWIVGNLASLKLGPVDLVDPATGISSLLAARAVNLTLLTGMVLPLLLALVLGPVFCSWVCPWGLLSELLDKVLRRQPRPIRGWVRPLRWSVLGLVLLGSLVLGMPVVSMISAPRLLSQLPLELVFLGGVSVATWAVLAGILALELVLPRRLWCRALCPVGSLLVLIRTPRTLTVGWKAAECKTGGCGVRCVQACSWNLDPRRMNPLDGCTNCGACVEGCPPEPVAALEFLRGIPTRARRSGTPPPL